MKITSGKFKYRNIVVPGGIRPTTEKVREAVFSMIMQWIPDAQVLDLFAGSGAMGLEALSRGAASCCFVESVRQNQKVLASNIENCGAGSEASVYGMDFEAALRKMSSEKDKPVFDIVIMDPPYEKTEYYASAMMMLQEFGLIDEGSVVVCEHLYDNKLSDIYGNLSKFKEKKYGSIGVDLFFVDNSESFC